MRNLSNIGRIFYGIAIAGLGFQTIYYYDFPYMVIPPKHSWIPGLATVAYIFGTFLFLAGACVVFRIRGRAAAFLLGTMFLLIFCFYHVPYQFISTSDYLDFGKWENAEKELALSSGAFVMAGPFLKNNETAFRRLLRKLISFGTILFSITIIIFGIDHFLYANDVADYIPLWVPAKMFWTYFGGTALIASGIGVLFKIKPRLFAALLGTMILIWVIILHIPKVIASPSADMGSEATSAFLALAYGGIAYVIAGNYRFTSGKILPFSK
jgi:uncharacterized membrane protein